MAGHSKWANIKHRKQAQDAKRGKVFTKLIRELTVAARQGGDDISSNARLRLAISKAYAANMSKDTVEKAIQRGAGNLDGKDMSEIRYEGYAFGGVAIMVYCLTDNKNRTVAEVRHAFTKCGGKLGTTGSVAYLFEQQGMLSYSPENKVTEEELMECALNAGAEDIIVNDDNSKDIITSPSKYEEVLQALQQNNLNPDIYELSLFAQEKVTVTKDNAEKVQQLINKLEDLDDVQNVYTNAEFIE